MAKLKFEDSTMGVLEEDTAEPSKVSEDNATAAKSDNKKKKARPKRTISKRGRKKKDRQSDTGEDKYLDSQVTTYLSHEAALEVERLRYEVRKMVPAKYRTKISQSLIIDQLVLSQGEERGCEDLADRIMGLLKSMEESAGTGIGDFRKI